MQKLATVAAVFAIGLVANGCSQSACEDLCDEMAKCDPTLEESGMKEESISACKDYCDETQAKNERASCTEQYDAAAQCASDNKDAVCEDEAVCKAEGDSYTECMVAYCEPLLYTPTDSDGEPIKDDFGDPIVLAVDPYCCSERWVACNS